MLHNQHIVFAVVVRIRQVRTDLMDRCINGRIDADAREDPVVVVVITVLATAIGYPLEKASGSAGPVEHGPALDLFPVACLGGSAKQHVVAPVFYILGYLVPIYCG